MEKPRQRNAPKVSTAKSTLRVALAGLAVILTAVVVTRGYIVKRANVDSKTTLESRAYNELTKAAIELRIDEAQSLFQLSWLIIAALWGLIIAKKDEAHLTLGDRPELVMFLCASLLLLLSLWWHVIYLHSISDAYKTAGATVVPHNAQIIIPDVFDTAINDLLRYQEQCLGFGSLLAILTLFSAHQLKEGGETR
jgi:hypothetical protein